MENKKGKFVSSGGWACIFTNESSMCIPDDDEKYLIKINKHDYKAEEEWEIAKLLETLDPGQKYFVFPTYKCHVSIGDIKRMNYYSPCSFLTSKKDDETIMALYMPYAGKTIEQYFLNNKETSGELINFKNAKKIFYKIAKDLHVLYKAGYMHHDLKGDNIVIEMNEKKVRLIDFGVMIPSSYYFTESYNVMLQIGQGQVWNPPENRFVFELDNIYEKITNPSSIVRKEQLPIFFMKLCETEMDKLNYKLSQQSKKPVSVMMEEIVFSSEDSFIDLYTNAVLDFLDEFYDYTSGTVKFKKLQAFSDRVDVYGFGICLLELYEFINFSSERDDKSYKKLLFHCLHPNILKRWSLRQVLDFLSKKNS